MKSTILPFPLLFTFFSPISKSCSHHHRRPPPHRGTVLPRLLHAVHHHHSPNTKTTTHTPTPAKSMPNLLILSPPHTCPNTTTVNEFNAMTFATLLLFDDGRRSWILEHFPTQRHSGASGSAPTLRWSKGQRCCLGWGVADQRKYDSVLIFNTMKVFSFWWGYKNKIHKKNDFVIHYTIKSYFHHTIFSHPTCIMKIWFC